jgi:Protein of unknown function (DUF3999)
MKTWIVAIVALTAGLSAQEPRPPRFRVERPIAVDRPGPARLAVDLPLLSGAGVPTLADLRLFGPGDAAVPYLLLSPPSGAPEWIRGRVLPLVPTEKTSGYEVDLGTASPVDAMRVDDLRAPFLKRLILEGSGDREHWTMLAGEGTLFDLPDERLRQTEVAFAAGVFRYLRVTWNDTNSGRLLPPAAVFARRAGRVLPPPPMTADLPVERRPAEPGRSRYHIRLPAPRLPVVAIDVNVGSGHVFRSASIFESRVAGFEARPVEIGRAVLTQVVRGGVAAGALRIAIQPPIEPALDLVVEDGSNAPLDIAGVSLVFAPLPWIYFEAPAGPIVARYGDALVAAPRYDLEAARETIEVATVPDAKWGEPRPLEASAAPVAAAPMPETGSAIDIGLFATARDILPGPAGLVALALDAAVLTESRGPLFRFADVRIVDPSNRQIPYIVERRDEPLTLALSLGAAPATTRAGAATSGTRSRYIVKLPHENLAGTLVLETRARVFQRRVQVGVDRTADRSRRDPWFEVLLSQGWSHVDQDTAAPALSLPVPAVPTADLIVTVDEGDNSPLPIDKVSLLLPSYRLRFYRPAGVALRLVYGQPDLPPPQYDMALLTAQVMGAEATDVAPAATATRAADRPTFISPRAFWIFLTVAVVVLLGLIARLLKSDAR